LESEAKMYVAEFQEKRKEEDYLAIRHCQGNLIIIINNFKIEIYYFYFYFYLIFILLFFIIIFIFQ